MWSTLGESFNLQAGKFISADDIHEESSHYPYRCFGGNGIRGYVATFNRTGDYPIIGRQGALCGNINYGSGEFYATEHAVVVESFGGTNTLWARYLIEQLNLNQYATATAQPGLSVKTINEVAIPIPPVGEQQRIATAINRCIGIISDIQLSNEELQAKANQAKSHILNLAIHGKLVPQDPSDEPAICLLRRINPDFQIPLPPVEEQRRIAKQVFALENSIKKLDEEKLLIQSSIESAKAKILNLAIHGKLIPHDPADESAIELLKRINPDFKPSYNLHYDEALPSGWAITPLYIICDTITGLWKGKKEPLINVGVIRNANFTKDFTLDYSKIEYIDVEQKSFEKRNLENGDIIVEKSGGSDNFPVGRSILYRGENGKYSFSNFTMSLRIAKKDCILPEYLYYVLQYRYRRGDMKQLQTQTTGLHNLLTDKFMSLTIPIPPVEEQLRIVQTIKNLFGIVNGIRDLVNDNKQGINSL